MSQRSDLRQDDESGDRDKIVSQTSSSLKQEYPVSQRASRLDPEPERAEETPSAKGDCHGRQTHPQDIETPLSENRDGEGKDHKDANGSPRLITYSPTSPLKTIQNTASERPHSSPAPVHNPVVLVPDSDVSGSHSQSLSNTHPLSSTQLSVSQHHFPSQQNPQASTSQEVIPPTSHHETSPAFPERRESDIQVWAQKQDHDTADHEENQLDSDDEAAHMILISDETSHPRLHQDVTRISAPQPNSVYPTHPSISDMHDPMNQGSSSSNDPPKSKERVLSMPAASHETETRYGRKRALAELVAVNSPGAPRVEVESSTKRQKKDLPGETVIEELEYDVLAWKQPSFARTRAKAADKEETEQVLENRVGM